LIADEQTRTDVALKRGFFRRFAQRFMDSTRFIFFDETSAKTNMTRLYGRAPGGERLVDCAPHGYWKTTTFVAGLSLDGIVAPVVFEGPIDGPSFLAYVEQMVCPCLRPGHVLLMDNLSSHKQPAVERRSAPSALPFSSPHLIRRISIRSRISSPSSRPICAGPGANQIRPGRRHRRLLRSADADGMRELLPPLWIWSHLTGNGSSVVRRGLNDWPSESIDIAVNPQSCASRVRPCPGPTSMRMSNFSPSAPGQGQKGPVWSADRPVGFAGGSPAQVVRQ